MTIIEGRCGCRENTESGQWTPCEDHRPYPCAAGMECDRVKRLALVAKSLADKVYQLDIISDLDESIKGEDYIAVYNALAAFEDKELTR